MKKNKLVSIANNHCSTWVLATGCAGGSGSSKVTAKVPAE